MIGCLLARIDASHTPRTIRHHVDYPDSKNCHAATLARTFESPVRSHRERVLHVGGTAESIRRDRV
jgi:hypothetical protein